MSAHEGEVTPDFTLDQNLKVLRAAIVFEEVADANRLNDQINGALSLIDPEMQPTPIVLVPKDAYDTMYYMAGAGHEFARVYFPAEE